MLLGERRSDARDVRLERGFHLLELRRRQRLARGESGILDSLGPQFERALITKALARTGGRRIDAANRLGMGRNTITRKIQELGIEDDPGPEKES